MFTKQGISRIALNSKYPSFFLTHFRRRLIVIRVTRKRLCFFLLVRRNSLTLRDCVCRGGRCRGWVRLCCFARVIRLIVDWSFRNI
jgi:hypothetical protein